MRDWAPGRPGVPEWLLQKRVAQSKRLVKEQQDLNTPSDDLCPCGIDDGATLEGGRAESALNPDAKRQAPSEIKWGMVMPSLDERRNRE